MAIVPSDSGQGDFHVIPSALPIFPLMSIDTGGKSIYTECHSLHEHDYQVKR